MSDQRLDAESERNSEGKSGEKEKLDWRRAVFLLLVCSVALALIYGAPTVAYNKVGITTATEWERYFLLPDASEQTFYRCKTLAEPASKSSAVACREFSDLEIRALNDAEQQLTKLGNAQLGVARAFFGWQYLATLAGLIAGSLSAAALLAISLYGWQTAPLWARSFFIVCSASAAFWLAVPQLYQYDPNLAAAQKRHGVAATTVWQIKAVRATGRDSQGGWVEPQKFIHTVSARVPEVALGLAFDQSKAVPQKLEKPAGV
ncbi:hypothetical protein J7E70_13075 [Variovorax paradoxus]|nr:hypothetical protein [Variovorax paradoxus]MBT2301393.1 hypothetical protein [Variovorax paradoxus]